MSSEMQIMLNAKLGRLYAGTIPVGSAVVGIVCFGCTRKGALVVLANRVFAQINAGVVRNLNQRNVRDILTKLN